MNCILLTPAEKIGLAWLYRIEDLGPQWRCTLVSSAQRALVCLAEGVDVLLLLPCRESEQLLRAVEARPPLAPPFILGEGAPDGGFPHAEALPALLDLWRQEGKLPALAWRHMDAAMALAAALLRTMEVPRRLKAWEFLPEMCALAVVHPPLLQDLQHGLYPLIGKGYGLTAAAVERRLRLCVESLWMHGSLPALERFFGSSVDPERGKPTNREFLCRMQERLTLAMRRLV